jgi:hypothetical protein
MTLERPSCGCPGKVTKVSFTVLSGLCHSGRALALALQTEPHPTERSQVTTEQPTGDNPDLIPTPPRGYPIPAPRRTTRNVVLAGIAGVAAGGLLVGGAWLLFGSGGVSSSPISAPPRVSDYTLFGDAAERIDRDKGKELGDRYRDWDQRSSERLSAAHDNAGAFVRTYTDDKLEQSFTVEAVRAPAPYPPYVSYSDPKVLGMDRPTEELREFDDVGCLIRNDPSQSYVISCVRTDDDLTVQITHVTGDLLDDPEAVAKLVDTVWQELS